MLAAEASNSSKLEARDQGSIRAAGEGPLESSLEQCHLGQQARLRGGGGVFAEVATQEVLSGAWSHRR